MKALATSARFVVVDLIHPNMVWSVLIAITASVPTVPIRRHVESDAALPTEVDIWARCYSFLAI